MARRQLTAPVVITEQGLMRLANGLGLALCA
jgi:hypothetical protein